MLPITVLPIAGLLLGVGATLTNPEQSTFVLVATIIGLAVSIPYNSYCNKKLTSKKRFAEQTFFERLSLNHLIRTTQGCID